MYYADKEVSEMIVRRAYMEDGNVFKVSAEGILGCFERGYIYGLDGLGKDYVLNVSHILYFGPKEVLE